MIQEHVDIGELIMHHTGDAYAIDLGPYLWEYGKFLPDMHLGPLTLNLTPTKHVFFMLVSALLVFTISTAVRC